MLIIIFIKTQCNDTINLVVDAWKLNTQLLAWVQGYFERFPFSFYPFEVTAMVSMKDES